MAGQVSGKRAESLLDWNKGLHRRRFPWMKILSVKEEKDAFYGSIVDRYKTDIGDPDDPETQAKLQQEYSGMIERARKQLADQAGADDDTRQSSEILKAVRAGYEERAAALQRQKQRQGL